MRQMKDSSRVMDQRRFKEKSAPGWGALPYSAQSLNLKLNISLGDHLAGKANALLQVFLFEQLFL